MPYLNFHGLVLSGVIVQLDGHIEGLRIRMDDELAHWCHYELRLYGDTGMACSGDSRVVRTNLHLLIAALYDDWENVTKLLPVEIVSAAIQELHSMIEITNQYPIMIWEFTEKPGAGSWVADTLAKLPPVDVANFLFDLPHMRSLYSDFNIFCERNGCRTLPWCDRFAEKVMKRTFADRNKRMKAQRKQASGDSQASR